MKHVLQKYILFLVCTLFMQQSLYARDQKIKWPTIAAITSLLSQKLLKAKAINSYNVAKHSFKVLGKTSSNYRSLRRYLPYFW